MNLSTSIMIGVEDRISSTDYMSFEDRIVYDEEWDKTE